jgi:hypothetical protein
MLTHSLAFPPPQSNSSNPDATLALSKLFSPVENLSWSLSENNLAALPSLPRYVLTRPLHAITDQRRSDLTIGSPTFFGTGGIVSAVVVILLMFCAVIVMVKRVDNESRAARFSHRLLFASSELRTVSDSSSQTPRVSCVSIPRRVGRGLPEENPNRVVIRL